MVQATDPLRGVHAVARAARGATCASSSGQAGLGVPALVAVTGRPLPHGVDAKVATDEVRPATSAFHVGVPPLSAGLVAAGVVDGAASAIEDPAGVAAVAALAYPVVPARVPAKATVGALVLGALEIVADGPRLEAPSRLPPVGPTSRALRALGVHDAAAHGVAPTALPRPTGVADVAAPAEARDVAFALPWRRHPA